MEQDDQADIRIERLGAIDEDAISLIEEYYLAIQIIQRDVPEELRRSLREEGSQIWLAYLLSEPVGCVLMRRLESIPMAGECKRLYVKPSARGRHIADRLMDALEQFARDSGLKWLYLDSHEGLKGAIALYQRRGYKLCERYNDNPQATVFMRKYIK